MRHYRTVLGAAGAVVAGLTLAACGGGSSASGSSPSTNASPSPNQVVTAAYSKTVGGNTAKVNETGQISTTVNGTQRTVPITGAGTIDFANKSADLTESVAGKQGANIEVRYLNDMLYVRLPANAIQVSGGKPWIAVSVAQLAKKEGGSAFQQLLSSAPSDPSNELAYIRSINGNVQQAGKATVDGTPTTHYLVTVDLNKVAQAKPAAANGVKRLEQQLGTSKLPMQLWIDQQGRVRQLRIDETIAHPAAGSSSGSTSTTRTPNVGPVHAVATVVFSDYGAPVHIVAPPANQTDNLSGTTTGG